MPNAPDDRWATGDAYDAYMGRWSRPLARAFVAWLHPKPSANWLEIGCGTGALTSTVCELCEPASVVASNPSAPFIEHARKNLPDARVTFIAAGAEALPRRNGGFDVAVSGLVLNFLPDPEAAVASVRERVPRGGTVAATSGITRQVWSVYACSGKRRSPWTRARSPSTRGGVSALPGSRARGLISGRRTHWGRDLRAGDSDRLHDV